MNNKATYVKTIDLGNGESIEVYRYYGGLFAIDSSYLETVADDPKDKIHTPWGDVVLLDEESLPEDKALNPTPQILLEVLGGVLINVSATQQMDVVILDHDDLNQAGCDPDAIQTDYELNAIVSRADIALEVETNMNVYREKYNGHNS